MTKNRKSPAGDGARGESSPEEVKNRRIFDRVLRETNNREPSEADREQTRRTQETVDRIRRRSRGEHPRPRGQG